VLAVIGAFLALVAFGTGAAGGVLVWAHTTQRDSAGFYSTNTERLQTDSYALVSERVDFGTRVGDNEWTPFDEQRGDLRIRARSADGRAVFIGIARSADVERYLRGVPLAIVRSGDGMPFDPAYRFVDGSARPETDPINESFWFAAASGTGRQSVTWDAEAGSWTAVVMNADGSPGVVVDAAVAARTALLLPVGVGLLAFAALAAFAGVALVLASAMSATKTLYHHPIPTPVVEGSYPVRVNGHLDLELSRWKWLVKWFLVIPHLLLLGLLWPVVVVVTLAAAVAIVVTGRYPRALFDLNVGVMRWTWRVTFYAFTLGTDRYPPFSLAPDPSYPADLTVEYPVRLSRGMVFVKWLLALPHYLVIAIFGGLGMGMWQWGDDRFAGFGTGLVGLIVLVAAVVLTLSGRYPQQLFDVVMGMQRWSYRVYAYTGLMTDEYPPFRFDGGGTDPGSMPESAPVSPVPSDDLTPTW
jgi:hypothetical protein